MARAVVVPTQHGLTITYPGSVRRRRSGGAYPLPDIPTESALIQLQLVVADQARRGIRVLQTVEHLPGGAAAVWTLQHLAWQGPTRPDASVWDEVPLPNGRVDYVWPDALAGAHHIFRLRRLEAGQLKVWPEAAIDTPDDPALVGLRAWLDDDVISASEKRGFGLQVQSYLDSASTDLAAATEWDVPAAGYLAARDALAAAVAAMAPPLSDLAHDTSLGAGGGDALLAKISALLTLRPPLLQAVERARRASVAEGLSDDRVGPGEKRRIKQLRDQLANSLVELDALDDVGTLAQSSKDALTAFWAAQGALETYLDALAPWNPATHDWDSYAGTTDLGTGGGPALWATIEPALTSEAAARRLVAVETRTTVASMASNGIISAGAEKSELARERAKVSATYSSYSAQRSALGITGKAWDDYLQAKSDLDTYCGGLQPALWLTSVDTPVDPSLWDARWTAYWAAEVAMAKAILDKLSADTRAAKLGVPTPVDTLPALPDALWPADRLALLRSDWMDPASGKVRCRGLWQVAPDGASWTRDRITADMIVDRLAAGQVEAAFLTAAFAEVGYLKTRNFAGKKADGTTTTDPAQAVRVTAGAAMREQGTPAILASADGILMGGTPMGEIAARALVGIQATALSAADYRVAWKGNCDPGSRYGAPNPSCLTVRITDAYFDGQATHYRIQVIYDPATAGDNMDALTWLGIYIDGQPNDVVPTMPPVSAHDRYWTQTVCCWVRGNNPKPPTLQVILANSLGTIVVDLTRSGDYLAYGSAYSQGTVQTPLIGGGLSGPGSAGGRPGSNVLQAEAGLT